MLTGGYRFLATQQCDATRHDKPVIPPADAYRTPTQDFVFLGKMQPQYRAYAQQVPQRSPHATNQRRGGIGTFKTHPPSFAQPDQVHQSSTNMDAFLGPMMSSGPHPSVPLTQAQIAQQQQVQAHASELAKRRSRKPTDKNIPDGVEDSIVDPDGVQRYKELRDVERRLDATITRKRLDVVDYTSRGSKVCSTTRRFFLSFFGKNRLTHGSEIQNLASLDHQHSRGSNLAEQWAQL